MTTAQQYCTGPVFVYVNRKYLGTGERAPRRRHEAAYSAMMNDLSGVVHPFDMTYQGRIGIVTVRLTRWDYDVLLDLYERAKPPIGAGGFDGLDQWGTIGSFAVLEGASAELALVYPYGTLKPAMNNMPRGYRYPVAVLETDEEQPGTNALHVDLTWRCIGQYDNVTGNITLYDHDVNGLPQPT